MTNKPMLASAIRQKMPRSDTHVHATTRLTAPPRVHLRHSANHTAALMTAGNATTSNTPEPFSSTSVVDPYAGANNAAASRPTLQTNASTVRTNALRPGAECVDVTREAYPRDYSADSRISACWSSGG